MTCGSGSPAPPTGSAALPPPVSLRAGNSVVVHVRNDVAAIVAALAAARPYVVADLIEQGAGDAPPSQGVGESTPCARSSSTSGL